MSPSWCGSFCQEEERFRDCLVLCCLHWQLCPHKPHAVAKPGDCCFSCLYNYMKTDLGMAWGPSVVLPGLSVFLPVIGEGEQARLFSPPSPMSSAQLTLGCDCHCSDATAKPAATVAQACPAFLFSSLFHVLCCPLEDSVHWSTFRVSSGFTGKAQLTVSCLTLRV